MKLDKTKVMFNDHIISKTIYVEDLALKVVQERIYLGFTLQMGRDNFEGEIAR